MIVALSALVTALALASLAVSFYALYRAHRLVHMAQTTTETVRGECVAAIETAQSEFNAIGKNLRTAKAAAPAEILQPGISKPGMNLTRRSHALRLHREGSSPEQIAYALEVPRQEVVLLLKVHEIVLNNL